MDENENETRVVPPHVLARTAALDAAFDALARADGRLPATGAYATDYLQAVHQECVRELYGMLDSLTLPRGETWLPVLASEEHGLSVAFATKEERHQNDNSIILLVEHGEARVGMLSHGRESSSLQVRLPGGERGGIGLVDALGAWHAVVERIDYLSRRGFAPGGLSVVVVGYVGDLVASMTAAHLPAARDDERADLKTETGPRGFNADLLTALSTGVRAQTQWPVVPRDRVPHLNETQYRAIDTLGHNVELIRGPPGTGKSTLIDAVVRECVAGADAVCVTAVQNRAVEVCRFTPTPSHTVPTSHTHTRAPAGPGQEVRRRQDALHRPRLARQSRDGGVDDAGTGWSRRDRRRGTAYR